MNVICYLWIGCFFFFVFWFCVGGGYLLDGVEFVRLVSLFFGVGNYFVDFFGGIFVS